MNPMFSRLFQIVILGSFLFSSFQMNGLERIDSSSQPVFLMNSVDSQSLVNEFQSLNRQIEYKNSSMGLVTVSLELIQT
jgi:hypothetical protein